MIVRRRSSYKRLRNKPALRLYGGGHYDVFLSTAGKACEKEVDELKSKLEERGCSVFVTKGAEKGKKVIDNISAALKNAPIALIMAPETYGEQESAQHFSSKKALEHILRKRKPFFLIKMCKNYKEISTRHFLAYKHESQEFAEWEIGTELDLGIVDRVFTFVYSAQADGTVKEAKPGIPKEGFGEFTFSDGSTFIGTWASSKPDGFGRMEYADGSVYEGQFKEGLRHGKAKYRYGEKTNSPGATYEGIFTNDEITGTGIITFSPFGGNAGEKYVGEWKDGQKHGYGTYFYKSNGKYNGQWINDVKEGEGDFEFPNGDFYTGNYENGKREGYGEYAWADGDRYKGNWKSDKRHGYGELFRAETNDTYVGDFVDGAEEGHGEMRFGNGDVYEGEWKEGEMHGKGKFIFKNGKEVNGTWNKGDLVIE